MVAPSGLNPPPVRTLRDRLGDLLGGRLRLDRRLAAGVDPLAGPALARRAAALRRPRTRQALATAIERVVIEAERPPRRLGAAAPVARDEVLDARMELLLLAATLRTAPDPAPRGLAAASVLISDVAGPMFGQQTPGALRTVARRAREAL